MRFPEELKQKIVDQYTRVNFKQDIARAFLNGFEHKTQTTEGACNEGICACFIRNYKRSSSYNQIQNSPFQYSKDRRHLRISKTERTPFARPVLTPASI
jgi:hypothetical protein